MNTLSKIGLAAVIFTICGLYINAVQDPPTDEKMEEKLINNYNVYALPMPEYLEFAGERVPLNNPDIRERFDRELLVNTYWQSNMFLIIKRAHKFFPQIEPLLAEYGLPDDFKYLAVAESGLDNVRSNAGASGFWQFMKGTGKEYGLEINDYVDERYNMELATKVAAEYLKRSKERFGSWTAAAAAYNAGNAGVNKQMERQDVSDYYDLLLNDETSRYVFRILAFKEILSNPQKYGFNFRGKDLYTQVPTYKVMVDKPVEDFAKFAKEYGINYKILKIHNPWLRDTYLNNASGKQYFIEIPENGYYTFGQ
ncbi:lytic transglycosylase domain-containing protein [Ulvibacter antarcticus]|uniref:Transglycosylase-like protein with SLT domain n=1 Tax=Ulvibacter antarcticus TaxID=442714 RepID=A0A3L9YWE5_9FLAO|nr:lytic transglycosylase domain-containing protein [Ulvibacter antarcticus]RMA64644.1 transglycosylase-like protein with SLT domain [Ulvibacter antarcticus]